MKRLRLISNENPAEMTGLKLWSQILDHIAIQSNKQDTLDGIILGVYEKKLKRIAGEVTKLLGKMTRAGIIVQKQNREESVVYRLNIPSKDVSSYLESLGQSDD